MIVPLHNTIWQIKTEHVRKKFTCRKIARMKQIRSFRDMQPGSMARVPIDPGPVSV